MYSPRYNMAKGYMLQQILGYMLQKWENSKKTSTTTAHLLKNQLKSTTTEVFFSGFWNICNKIGRNLKTIYYVQRFCLADFGTLTTKLVET